MVPARGAGYAGRTQDRKVTSGREPVFTGRGIRRGPFSLLRNCRDRSTTLQSRAETPDASPSRGSRAPGGPRALQHVMPGRGALAVLSEAPSRRPDLHRHAPRRPAAGVRLCGASVLCGPQGRHGPDSGPRHAALKPSVLAPGGPNDAVPLEHGVLSAARCSGTCCRTMTQLRNVHRNDPS